METQETGMIFSILVKEEGGMCVAHCLELDIVATDNTVGKVKKEMEDLILTQVDYAFSNGNLENLYHPAPAEVWKEFFECKNQIEERIKLESAFQKKRSLKEFVPPWIIAKTCTPDNLCHA